MPCDKQRTGVSFAEEFSSGIPASGLQYRAADEAWTDPEIAVVGRPHSRFPLFSHCSTQKDANTILVFCARAMYRCARLDHRVPGRTMLPTAKNNKVEWLSYGAAVLLYFAGPRLK